MAHLMVRKPFDDISFGSILGTIATLKSVIEIKMVEGRLFSMKIQDISNEVNTWICKSVTGASTGRNCLAISLSVQFLSHC